MSAISTRLRNSVERKIRAELDQEYGVRTQGLDTRFIDMWLDEGQRRAFLLTVNVDLRVRLLDDEIDSIQTLGDLVEAVCKRRTERKGSK